VGDDTLMFCLGSAGGVVHHVHGLMEVALAERRQPPNFRLAGGGVSGENAKNVNR
jgi:hypothetical protein